jgi:hypothetical protein
MVNIDGANPMDIQPSALADILKATDVVPLRFHFITKLFEESSTTELLYTDARHIPKRYAKGNKVLTPQNILILKKR